MDRGRWKRFAAAVLGAAVIWTMAGCGDGEDALERDGGSERITTQEESAGTPETKISSPSAEQTEYSTPSVVSDGQRPLVSPTVAATDFGLKIFRSNLQTGNNTLISPVSVLFALGMTANGADGNTREEFETALGMPMEEWNAYLYAYQQSLPNEENCRVTAANSIWIKRDPDLEVLPDFLQISADYYNAGVFERAFDDTTKDEINKWVDVHTDGMIKEILDGFPEDAVMYLINAMAFDAKWMQPYRQSNVWEGEFTREDGSVQNVDFMYSTESQFLVDENAVGFLKYYEGGKYAFAALLPAEDVPLENYIQTLTGERLHAILTEPVSVEVHAAIPKFEAEYETQLSKTLSEIGIEDAFLPQKADFTRLVKNGNIYISRVIHKTYICVDENGTKAAAATMVETLKSVAMLEEKYKEVYLDRPFVYFLVDCEEGLPIFMGTVYTIE